MKLVDALLNIQYDSSWGIWAELKDGELAENSEARYGQMTFENGGLLDEKVYVCNGEQIGDWLTAWHGCSPNSEDFELDTYWINAYLDEINSEASWDLEEICS